MSITMKAMPFDAQEVTDPTTGQVTYDRVAHSRDLADWLAAYFSNGILVRGSDLLTNELQVLYLSAVTCVVKPGIIVINGRTGFLETQETIEFDVGESNPRIDRVVAELNIADRNVYIKVLKGIANANPIAKGLTQTEDLYQIPLAQVRVNAGVSVIAGVIDERANYVSNVLLNLAPSEDITAATISISEVVRNLYGLSVDNANVDKALQAIKPLIIANTNLANSKLKVITGSYTGNGATDGSYTSQIINLGVTPKAVIVNAIAYGTYSILPDSTYTVSMIPGYKIESSAGIFFSIVTNGFKIGSTHSKRWERPSMNQTGLVYIYTAFI